MTAPDRVGTALTPRPAQVFFDALSAADERIRRDEDLAWVASFAPPVTTFAKCSCGSTFEVRGGQVDATAEEKQAAVEAVADMFGRAPLDELDARIVARVIDAINHQRASDDWEAQENWNVAHEFCGDDL